jgi:UDP-glucose 4-epimerase
LKVLVVGGAGYIGSVTVDQLLQAEHSVTVLDSLVGGHREAVNPEAELVVGDVRDEDALARMLASHSFDAVVYYGGYIQAGESVLNPGRYFANNVGGCIALLNGMAAYGVGRFVFSSSAAVYGEPDSLPLTEEAPLSTTPHCATSTPPAPPSCAGRTTGRKPTSSPSSSRRRWGSERPSPSTARTTLPPTAPASATTST